MNSARLSAEELAQEVADLKQNNIQLHRQCEQYEQAYNDLLHHFKQLQRHRFGQRSEAYEDQNTPQLSLFESPGVSASDSVEDDTNVVDIKAHKRKKNIDKGFPDHLPRKEFHIKVANENRVCGCGCMKQPLQPARHERLHYEPAVFEVWVELREQLACPNGCAGEVVIGEKPMSILPKARFTESVLAHVIVSKLDDRQPYYHLEKQFESRSGLNLPRQTMARSVIDCTGALQPLFNLLKDEQLDDCVGSLDATSLQVLNEPGRPATRKSYMYCFRGGGPGKQSVLYGYNAIDHKHYVANWYAGFEGTLHCDADPFFKLLFSSEEVSPSYCNLHARRKFEPIAKAAKTKGLADHAMRVYQRLSYIERLARRQKMNPEQRLALRQEKSLPIMNSFKDWLDAYYPTVLPKSPLGKAFAYCLNHWTGLCAFLENGRLEFDNNHTEREIKPLVVARKNFLFCASVKGAEALALHFSLIRTAKLHNLDPYRYYVAILNAVPQCQSVEDYEALLPWNIDLPKVGEVSQAA